jgi:hypothetical protein
MNEIMEWEMKRMELPLDMSDVEQRDQLEYWLSQWTSSDAAQIIWTYLNWIYLKMHTSSFKITTNVSAPLVWIDGKDFLRHYVTHTPEKFSGWTFREIFLNSYGYNPQYSTIIKVPPFVSESRLSLSIVKNEFPRCIRQVYYFTNRESSRENWELVAQLVTSHGATVYTFLHAWCDSTGFSCQGWIKLYIGLTLADIFTYALDPTQREKILKLQPSLVILTFPHTVPAARKAPKKRKAHTSNKPLFSTPTRHIITSNPTAKPKISISLRK